MTVTVTIECRSEAEAASLRQAAAFVAEMHQLAQGAPAGQALSSCESLALGQGRQLLRDALRGAALARIDADEQKGGPPGSARAPAGSASRGGTAAT
jgi:hypothetical protein